MEFSAVLLLSLFSPFFYFLLLRSFLYYLQFTITVSIFLNFFYLYFFQVTHYSFLLSCLLSCQVIIIIFIVRLVIIFIDRHYYHNSHCQNHSEIHHYCSCFHISSSLLSCLPRPHLLLPIITVIPLWSVSQSPLRCKSPSPCTITHPSKSPFDLAFVSDGAGRKYSDLHDNGESIVQR